MELNTQSFPGLKCGRGLLLNTHPLLVPLSWKSRAIPLPTLRGHTGPVTGSLYLSLQIELKASEEIYWFFFPPNSKNICEKPNLYQQRQLQEILAPIQGVHTATTNAWNAKPSRREWKVCYICPNKSLERSPRFQIGHWREIHDLYLKLLELCHIEECDIEPFGINILFADVESETTK